MTGLLIVGGEGPNPQALEAYGASAGLTVAADSGLQSALRLGLRVDVVVGDMDSIEDARLLERFAPERVLRYPRDKDQTDTEIGFELLASRGCRRIVIAGGGGGRMDHFMGIAMLFERPFAPVAWITHDTLFVLVEGSAELQMPPGGVVSFFPLGGAARVRSSRGLRWPLDGLEFLRGRASLSNEAIQGTVGVDMEEGRLLMVRDLRGPARG